MVGLAHVAGEGSMWNTTLVTVSSICLAIIFLPRANTPKAALQQPCRHRPVILRLLARGVNSPGHRGACEELRWGRDEFNLEQIVTAANTRARTSPSSVPL